MPSCRMQGISVFWKDLKLILNKHANFYTLHLFSQLVSWLFHPISLAIDCNYHTDSNQVVCIHQHGSDRQSRTPLTDDIFRFGLSYSSFILLQSQPASCGEVGGGRVCIVFVPTISIDGASRPLRLISHIFLVLCPTTILLTCLFHDICAALQRFL